jgi:hypothetical protein
MAPFIVGGIVEAVGKVADDLFTSDEERAKAELDAYNAETGRAALQTEITKVEAAHASIFVAGWRPAIGWIGAGAMAYQFIVYPFLVWGWALMQAAGWISGALTSPPMLQTEALWVILTGILGLGTLRTTEKEKGVENGRDRPPLA